MNAALVMTRLEVLRVFRNKRFLMFSVALPVILFSAFGSQKATADGLAFKTYYMISMAGYGALAGALMGNAMKISTENKSGWVRQLRLTAMPGWGYVTGKIAAALVTTVPSVLIVFGLGAAEGVRMKAWQWAVIAVSIWLGSIIFAGLAIAMGFRFDPDTVQPAVMLVFFPMSILGGQWGPIGGVTLQKWVGRWLPTGAVRNIGSDVLVKSSVSLQSVVVIVAWGALFALLASLSFRRANAA
jgi:ABC-2 type transport system permease protein